MNKNHTYGLVGVQNGAPEMLFAWRNYKWKYICGEQKRFSSCNCSCVTSPSAEKSLFVKNIIHFPLKNSLLLQLIFCFFFSNQLLVSSWICFVPVDTGWEKENMTELLHKPIGCGKRPEWNLNRLVSRLTLQSYPVALAFFSLPLAFYLKWFKSSSLCRKQPLNPGTFSSIGTFYLFF